MIRHSYNPVALAFLLIITLMLLLTSCNHKDLWMSGNLNYESEFTISYDRQWEYAIEGAIDWEKVWSTQDFGFTYNSLRPGIPASLYLIAYNSDKDEIARYSVDTHGEDVQLSLAAQSVLLFNSDTEYIVFDDLDKILEAIATTRSKERSTLRPSPYARNIERNASAPDVLYAAYLTHVHPGHGDDDFDESEYQIIMRPLVFTYLIRFNFTEGQEYLALARGAISGMASWVSLDDGNTSDSRCTVLFDAQVTENGVEAIVKSFGTPSALDDFIHGYGLNLEIRLKNGNILDYDFDITDQVLMQPRGGVIQIDGITISQQESHETDSAFDVEVDGWGEFEDIPIDINTNN